MSIRSLIVLCCSLAALHPAASAIAADEDSTDTSRGFDDTSYLAAVDDTQQSMSREVVELGHWLDNLFGTEEYRRTGRESQLRIGFESLLESGNVDVQPKVRLHLALPRTQKRLSLVIESTDDTTQGGDVDAQRRAELVTTNTHKEQEYSAGLRYFKELAHDWDLTTDAGVRLRFPSRVFARSRARHSWFYQEWEMRLSPSVEWNSHDDLRSSLNMLWQRPLPASHFFRSETEVTWVRPEHGFFYSQDFYISREFSATNALLYQVGVRGQSNPNDHVTQYFIDLRWRKAVHKKWLFVELRPELLWDEEQHFSPRNRLFITVEALFGDLDR